MKTAHLYLFCCLSFFSWGQNLIPNSDFEEMISCPTTFSNISDVAYWKDLPSADYYHRCNEGTGIPPSWRMGPKNELGYQEPRSGDAYAGIITTQSSGTEEYIRIDLKDSLLSGETYHVQFFFSASDPLTPTYGTNNAFSLNIGLLFSNDSMLTKNNIHNYNGPEKVVDSSLFSMSIIDSINWVEFHTTYTAQGGENYIYLGNMETFANSILLIDSTYIPPYSARGYVYVDDVYVGLASPNGCPDSTACNYNPFSQAVDSSSCFHQVDSVLNVNSCAPYYFQGNYYNSSGSYYSSNSNGSCDTNFTLYLNITADIGINVQNDTLWAVNPNNWNIQWSNGDTTNFIIPDNNGSYYLSPTNAPCSDTAWAMVNWLSIQENSQAIIHPNPADEYILVSSPLEKKIYNTLGEFLFSSKEEKLDISHLPQGIYYLKIQGYKPTVFIKR